MLVLVVLVFVAGLEGGGQLFPHEADGLKAKREKELRQIATEFKEGLLQNNVEAILKYVSKKHGMTCLDDSIPFEKVKRDLQDPNSYVSLYLFNPSRYKEKYGNKDLSRPVALKELFQTATDLRIEVVFMEPERFGYSWAVIHFATSQSQFGANLYLGYQRDVDEGWTIESGFYDCAGGL